MLPEKIWRNIAILITGTVFALFLVSNVARANTYPPTQNAIFYGDANGDTLLTGLDVIQFNNFVLSKPTAFDTLQPATPLDEWNTCDLDNNRLCTGLDVIQSNNYVLSKPVTIGGVPWVLENDPLAGGLPLTGNSSGVSIPFSVNLYSTYLALPSGRPGMSVIAEIDPSSPGTGTLSGRECIPNPGPVGPRDQINIINNQCAIAVTITDWIADPEHGDTESGTYGLAVMGNGDGDLILKFRTEASPGLDIPATSLTLNVEFGVTPCSVTLVCPLNVNENAPLSCPVSYTASCTDTLSLGAGNTCTGATVTDNFDETGSYDIPAQGEPAGPGSCVADVQMALDGANDSSTITIDEVNANPTITLTCAPGLDVFETDAKFCGISVSDTDLPAQTLTCSVNPSSTCTGISLTDCTSATVAAQGEAAGPGTCDVVIDVIDTMSGTDSDTNTLNVLEVNQNPVWSPLPSDLTLVTGQVYNQVNGGASDADIPAQPLNCEFLGTTCSFLSTYTGSGTGSTSCNMSFTAGTILESCTITVRVNDSMFGSTIDSANINVNQCVKYVDDSATGANNGSSWADAFTVIQDAANAAGAGCQVWVAQGTYSQPLFSTVPVLAMPANVDFYGGFLGTETALAQRGDPFTTQSVLNGAGSSYHIVLTNVSTRLDGFTIVNGDASGGGWNNDGGGIYNQDSSFTLVNSTIDNNLSQGNGGGLYNFLSSPTITNCIFSNNVSMYGGAIYNHDGSNPTITNCVFDSNWTGTEGGAIYNFWSSPTFMNCTFNSNAATGGNGGAFYNNDSTPVIFNTILWGDATSGVGPEIFDSGASWTSVFFSDVEGGWAGPGNIDDDPTFAGGPGGLRLLTNSPCRDRGTDAGAPADDLDGNPRPAGTGVDMGAYEYVFPVADWYVDDSATGLDNGTSWTDAFNVVQDAVDASSSGDVIFVAQGNYFRPIGGNEPVMSLGFASGLSIYGGFLGTESNLGERGDPFATPSVLEGAGSSYHVVLLSSAGTTWLDGFTIQNGSATGAGADADGGGLYADDTDLTIMSCLFNGNLSNSDGGGMYHEFMTSSTIYNTIFRDNVAFNGGAIYNGDASNAFIYNTVYTGNWAANSGGAMFNVFSTTNVLSSSFSNNAALSSDGGAIYNLSSFPFISNSILWGDSAAGLGPEIFDDGGSLSTVTFTDIQGGWAGAGNINVNPLYVGPPDLHLQTGSPCIDTGTAIGSPNIDLEMNARPDGGAFDMGAYEWQSPEADWYVNDTATGANDGTSWTDAFTVIQDAADASSSGDIIFVARGTYTRPIGGNEAVLDVKAGTDVYGGFYGVEQDLGQRDNTPISSFPSILDGENQSYHVVTMWTGDVFRLDGFTLASGNATGSGANADGGGIYVSGASATIANCQITGNNANSQGGGIYNEFNPTEVINTIIENNFANSTAGGVYNNNANMVLTNSLFIGNSATLSGGGMYNANSNPVIDNCSFTLNNAIGVRGGAMFNMSSTPVITNSIFWGDLSASAPAEIDGTPIVTYSDVAGGFAGIGNIDLNPLWVIGPGGDYYLSQIAAGEGVNSPCLNAGSTTAANAGMDGITTRTDEVTDTGTVDMGFHYPVP